MGPPLRLPLATGGGRRASFCAAGEGPPETFPLQFMRGIQFHNGKALFFRFLASLLSP